MKEIKNSKEDPDEKQISENYEICLAQDKVRKCAQPW